LLPALKFFAVCGGLRLTFGVFTYVIEAFRSSQFLAHFFRYTEVAEKFLMRLQQKPEILYGCDYLAGLRICLP